MFLSIIIPTTLCVLFALSISHGRDTRDLKLKLLEINNHYANGYVTFATEAYGVRMYFKPGADIPRHIGEHLPKIQDQVLKRCNAANEYRAKQVYYW